jgi:thiol:disulfide interchange protein DsbD
LGLPGLGGESKLTGGSGAPQIKAELFADRDAVAPGGHVDLAVRLTLPDGWHVYWLNRGEGGLETKFAWSLPAGWAVGDVRFPKPSRHVDETDAHTFILEGEPTFLTTLTAPANAQVGQEAEIGVEVSWLACRTMCYPGSKSLTIRLPVVAPAEQTKPIRQEDFDYARKQLPVPADQAKPLKEVKALASVDKIQPGAKFSIAVTFEVEPGYHINSHEPLEPGLIATDVFPQRTEQTQIARPLFPPGKVEEVHGEKLSVYRGKTALILPVQVDGDLKAGKELRFAGVVLFQACNDEKGTCDPPKAVEWSVTVPVAGPGEHATSIHQEIFGSIREAAGGKGFTLQSNLRATTVQEQHSLVAWLGLALLAGIILNITPCVLPVISIKVLSFVQQASESPTRVFRLGLAFSLGMMVVFNLLAVMATALGLVWGQHFQSPGFTIGMASVVFAFGLSMFGVFTLSVPQAVGTLAVKTEGEGYAGSIAKGALATVMGTPCLGPFLGPVLVWASAQPAAIVFLVFNTIGIGMALPYILLTTNPRWLRFVPKAGPWLTTFKQAMAFLLMGTVVYLLYILEGQLGGPAVIWTLVFLTAVAIACWMLGRFITFNTPIVTRLTWTIVAALVVLAAGLVAFRRGIDWNATATTTREAPSGHELPWVPFSLEKLAELTAQGKPVFLDITARWCPNCQYNSAFVFDTPEVAAAIEKHGVVPMLADWTARGKDIGDLIEKLAPGASIPLAAVFPAGRPDEPIVMLEIVTKQQVIDNLAKATEKTDAAAR